MNSRFAFRKYIPLKIILMAQRTIAPHAALHSIGDAVDDLVGAGERGALLFFTHLLGVDGFGHLDLAGDGGEGL